MNTLSFPVSRRKTAQLMKEAGVWVRYKNKYKATTNSDHKKPIYDNELKQDFAAQKPDQRWVQDITYIWTSAFKAPRKYNLLASIGPDYIEHLAIETGCKDIMKDFYPSISSIHETFAR